MAEIKIEKKKPVWPWIIAALIIVAILYFFVFEDNDNDNQRVETTTEQVSERDTTDAYKTTRNTGEVNAISDYTTYIDNPQMGLDHNYTNGAIKKLIAAVEAKARDVNVNLDADLNQAKEKAKAITKDPNSLKHANEIKEAGQIITRAMKTLQAQNFPNSGKEISEVETALKNIKNNQPTLEQKDAVKNFFSKAGIALTSMR